jgi:hypothetical protein
VEILVEKLWIKMWKTLQLNQPLSLVKMSIGPLPKLGCGKEKKWTEK